LQHDEKLPQAPVPQQVPKIGAHFPDLMQHFSDSRQAYPLSSGQQTCERFAQCMPSAHYKRSAVFEF